MKCKPATRSILSGSSTRDDGDSLASRRSPRSVKFSEAPIVYYDYDMMLSVTNLDQYPEEPKNNGVLRRLAHWVRRVGKKKTEEGREPPVISGPYRLCNASGSASLEYDAGKHLKAKRKRPSLKGMFSGISCT